MRRPAEVSPPTVPGGLARAPPSKTRELAEMLRIFLRHPTSSAGHALELVLLRGCTADGERRGLLSMLKAPESLLNRVSERRRRACGIR